MGLVCTWWLLCSLNQFWWGLSIVCSCSTPFHPQSHWGRFLYGSESLCQRVVTVVAQTVIISSIFSLNTTDGQSVLRTRAAATESRRRSWVEIWYIIYKRFRSLSRFLQVPAEAAANIWASCGADGDRVSNTNRLEFIGLSQKVVGRRFWNDKQQVLKEPGGAVRM